MKKRLLLIVFNLTLVLNIHSQAAVIDVSSIATAISNGYTMFQELMSTYEQLEMYWQEIQNMYENAKSLEFDDLANYDYASLAKALGLNDEYVEKMRDIQGVIKNKSMTINGIEFSLEDLYTTNIYKKLGKLGQQYAIDALQNLTPEEEQEFYNKTGMTVDEIEKMSAVAEVLVDDMKTNEAKLEIVKDYCTTILNESNSYLNKLAKETSETALMQGIGTMVARLNGTMTHVLETLNNTSKIITKSIHLEQKNKEIEENANNIQYGVDSKRQDFYSALEGDENSYIGPGSFKGF